MSNHALEPFFTEQISNGLNRLLIYQRLAALLQVKIGIGTPQTR